MRQLKVAVMMAVVVGVASGRNTMKDMENSYYLNYKWIQMYNASPVYWLPGFIYSFRLGGLYTLKSLGPVVPHLTLGYLDYQNVPQGFNVAYVMLESHRLVLEKPTVSLFGGVGVGTFETDWDNTGPNGIGFLLSGGLQFHIDRFVCDIRLNSGRGESAIVRSLSIGYKGNTFLGAVAGPAIVLSLIAYIYIWGKSRGIAD